MTITMQNLERLTVAEMKEFIAGSRRVGFAAKEQEAIYGLMEGVLKAQQYRRLSKGQKGLARRYLVKVTVSHLQPGGGSDLPQLPPPGGHGAPGKPRRPARPLPHQRRPHGHPMAGAGLGGDHCDKGSEFLNHTVARLLNKLLIEFTKSRPCRTTGNALVEGNDGAVVRSWVSGSFLDWKMLEEAPGRSGKQQPPGGVDQCVGHHGGADAAGFLIGQAIEQPGNGRQNGEAPVGK
jgi:hypothetical protein